MFKFIKTLVMALIVMSMCFFVFWCFDSSMPLGAGMGLTAAIGVVLGIGVFEVSYHP